MGDFFKPWRRKIGVLTLVMACFVAAGWVRSFVVEDNFGDIISQNGVIKKVEYRSTAGLIVLDNNGNVLSQTIDTSPTSWEEPVWRIPYWWIVIPLTLLSAWLLLGKRRMAKQKTIVENRISE